MINLKEKEKIILIKRRHIFVLFFRILPLLFIFLAIIVAMVYSFFVSFSFLSEPLDLIGVSMSETKMRFFALFLLSCLLLFLWQIFLVKIAHYYLDCWIVTDKRTIHTELHSLFNRFLSTVYHHRIQDVSVDVKGILPTFFRYGDVQIQTAGTFREFVFREIPEPYKTKEIITQTQINFLRDTVSREVLPNEDKKEDLDKLAG